ncbi:MAG: FAD-dependent oxidoreductase, partial [Methanobacteriota archaeon]
MHYDIVVVGAGPAGCYTAKTAAENGAKVLLLDEHSTVGLPECCCTRNCLKWCCCLKRR